MSRSRGQGRLPDNPGVYPAGRRDLSLAATTSGIPLGLRPPSARRIDFRSPFVLTGP